MALIKSISGIRGTIGGRPGEGLTPLDVVKFTAAYGTWLLGEGKGNKVVVGRDARISGDMVARLAIGTLQGLGIDVVDLGISTTPTVEMAVTNLSASGGIILTASHNPKEWNALKLLNDRGEFISAEIGGKILSLAESAEMDFAGVENIGKIETDHDQMQGHINAILDHPLVDIEAIRKKGFTVALDPINSSGALFVPALLEALGVSHVSVIHGDMNGDFAHNPEPLPDHLKDLSEMVAQGSFDMGIAVDPDVDRLCFICENGAPFGEEYTLVAVADYVLSRKPGNTVSNLSSTRALKDVTEKHGGKYYSSAVGEVNVVAKMKAVGAVIGGEGNGGIIDPELHYGRDALVGIALFLTHLALSGTSLSQLRESYPDYYMSKNKIDLVPGIEVASMIAAVKSAYGHYLLNEEDGLKIEMEEGWVHLRGSNTEPIIRIYAEGKSLEQASALAAGVMDKMRELMR